MRAGIALVVALITGVAGPASASASAFKLPDTDQRTCHPMVEPYFGQVPCAGTGQDGEHIGNPLSYTVNDDGTVTDDNTGLEWQQQDDGKTYNWFSSASPSASFKKPLAASACSLLTLGGYSDWRLPTRKELMSIVDYSVPAPGVSIDLRSFTDTKSSGYWSSTTRPGHPDLAWRVEFSGGKVDNTPKQVTLLVRCVRGESWTNPRLTDNGSGTVTDDRTGLTWQKGEPGSMTWGAALAYCTSISLDGHADWRLPNIKELQSLADDARDRPAIDSVMFPGARPSFYWASNSYPSNPDYAWRVDFQNGSADYYHKYLAHHVRCVRGWP